MPDNPAIIPINALRSPSTHVRKRLQTFHHEYTVLVIEQFERRPGGILVIVDGLCLFLNPGTVKGKRILRLVADVPLYFLIYIRSFWQVIKPKKYTAFTFEKKHHIIDIRTTHQSTSVPDFTICIGGIVTVNHPNASLCIRYECSHIYFTVVTDHKFLDFRLRRCSRNNLGITVACRQQRRRQD